MRQLIKPTLFLVVRLGLLFSLIAWGVTHSRSAHLESPVGGILVVQQGVVFHSLCWPYWTCFTFESNNDSDFFEPLPPSRGRISLSFAGITFLRWSFMSLSFRHWLIVTMFTALNICLHWFYRKRSEVQRCEN